MPAVGVTEIDWDNMLPSYKDDDGTSAERDAVATLMLLCGNSVEMTYGIDGSSASINYARMVLPEYFDYDGFSIGYVNRSGYDNADWNQLMYDELSNNGPVLYKGNSKQYGGHAFVIDGYDADDYFHVNWGWGGNDDGYFLLDALKDYKTQGAIIGLKRNNSTGACAYSVLDSGVLTFYYDDKRQERSGTVFTRLPGQMEDSYLKYLDEITSVVFDPSFAEFHELMDVSHMFHGLENLTSIKGMEYLDTRKVTNMNQMFYNCSALTSLDVSAMDTRNVSNMNDMFYGCEALTSLDVSGFDTRNVTDMKWMFFGCESLTALDVSGFDTGKVTDMESLFSGCMSVKVLDVSGFDTKNVRYMNYMFNYCKSLTSVDASGFDMQSVRSTKRMFACCDNLASVSISSTAKNLNDYTFEDCFNLKEVTCYATDVPSVGKGIFDEVPVSDATLYVPASALEAYKAADVWKDFGTILPIEPTAVEEVKVTDADNDGTAPFYDLTGRRYNGKPKSGIYIHKGKKVVIE